MYDIVIVGAGPAGAVLARLVSNKYKVLVLEKRARIAPSTAGTGAKCCGGLLAPDAQAQLACLGLGLPRELLIGPQLFAVRTIDIDHHLERFYQRHYINMDRGRFDEWLLTLIPQKVEVRLDHRVVSCDPGPESVHVKYFGNKKMESLHTRFLVGADGAWSVVRRYCRTRRRTPTTYYAIQEWHRARQILPYYTAIFDRSITDFYSWIIPKEDMLLLGSALEFGVNVQKRMDSLKEHMRSFNFNFRKAERVRSAALLRPQHPNQISVGKGRIALIGEAAGFISPSSAEGLSYAFKSACILAEIIRDYKEKWVDHFERDSLSLRMQIILKNLKSPFMYYPPLRNIIMTLGLRSIQPYQMS